MALDLDGTAFEPNTLQPSLKTIPKGLTTGLRQGELLALRWEDVDLVRGRLLVRRAVARGVVGTPKSGKSREIPLNEKALAALKRQRHLRGELVFCDAAGRMLRKGACKWPLWTACRRAGLRRIGWHTLRHTFASHLVMLNSSRPTVTPCTTLALCLRCAAGCTPGTGSCYTGGCPAARVTAAAVPGARRPPLPALARWPSRPAAPSPRSRRR